MIASRQKEREIVFCFSIEKSLTLSSNAFVWNKSPNLDCCAVNIFTGSCWPLKSFDEIWSARIFKYSSGSTGFVGVFDVDLFTLVVVFVVELTCCISSGTICCWFKLTIVADWLWFVIICCCWLANEPFLKFNLNFLRFSIYFKLKFMAYLLCYWIWCCFLMNLKLGT